MGKMRWTWVLALLVSGPVLAAGLPAPVNDILFARPFSLEEGYHTSWQADGPLVSSGYVVVLEVEPYLAVQRAGVTPVLCAGGGTIERVNPASPSGVLVGIVRDVDDLTNTLVWFASRGYPGDFTPETVEAERAAAIEAGITPLDPGSVSLALAEGGEALEATGREELLDYARQLVETYVPAD